jgi:hypothetical protein
MRKLFILGLLVTGACNHVAEKKDTRSCCERLSLHDKEMQKFTRYCKVAVFLNRSNSINDANIKKNVQTAVDVCKYVFRTDTETDLMTKVELNDMGFRKVRYYIIDSESMFWSDVLPCDPEEFTCEEF